MKKFDKVKTIQMIIFIIVAAIMVYIAFFDKGIQLAIAVNPHLTVVGSLLWFVVIISFVFMFYDFSTYSDLKREYSELDLAIFSDPTTGMANRYSCDAFIEQYLDKPLPDNIGCITIDITNLGEINKTNGHRAGNAAIRSFSNILQGCAINVCFVGRNGGNKFLAIFTNASDEKMNDFLKRLEEKVSKFNEKENSYEIRYAYGCAFNESSDVKEITDLIALSNNRAAEGK